MCRISSKLPVWVYGSWLTFYSASPSLMEAALESVPINNQSWKGNEKPTTNSLIKICHLVPPKRNIPEAELLPSWAHGNTWYYKIYYFSLHVGLIQSSLKSLEILLLTSKTFESETYICNSLTLMNCIQYTEGKCNL